MGLLMLIPFLLIAGLIWLMWTVASSASRITELSERVERLQNQVALLRRDREAGPVRAPETSRAASPDEAAAAAQAASLARWAAPEESLATGPQEAPPIPVNPPPILAPPPLQSPEPQPWRVNPPLPPELPLEWEPASEPMPASAKPINWEQFLGVKMFAWISGFAFFLGVAFFIKYSFEHNLIPPELRVALGFLVGIGLVAGGVLVRKKEFAVLSQSLSATGVVVLYAVAFGANALYHLTGPALTFGLMCLITGAAFLLAVRMDAQVVAILGLVGGFLTPPLLSTGVDNPLGLFGYVALLNVGLLAVAFRRGWNYLFLLGLLGTLFMEIGWTAHFFTARKIFIAQRVFLGFSLFYFLAVALGEKLKKPSQWLTGAAVAQPFFAIAFGFFLISEEDFSGRPGVLFTLLFSADLLLLGVILLRRELHSLKEVVGIVAFLFLALWTRVGLTNELLFWGLGAYLLFGTLHSLFPLALRRLRPEENQTNLAHLFPPLALALFALPLVMRETVSLFLWPFILLVDLLAFGLALLTASLVSVVSVLILTAALALIWIFQVPADPAELSSLFLIIGFLAIFFFGGSLLLFKKMGNTAFGIPGWMGTDPQKLVPALSALLPFLLLIMATVRLPMPNPSPLFGLALLLVALLLGLVKWARLDPMALIALGCALGVEHAWFTQHYTVEQGALSMAWFGTFYLVFTVFPFCFRREFSGRVAPWAASALAGPLHFYLIYKVFSALAPSFAFNGLIPALFALPPLAALYFFLKALPDESPSRLSLLAWYGGVALFFITLIFPIQFDRQWITLGWALEGAALLWLFHRVPHSGLRATGVPLLVVAFTRLALNPAVFSYSPRSATPIFNWFLYSYGIVTVCLLAGGRLLAAPRHRVLGLNAPPLLYTLGTILAFLLLNIEIADYFADGPRLAFDFSGNFARDMTYSIAWALFAVALLIIGIHRKLRAVRYASIALIGVTLLKLFLHDLSRLGQLYRIGAFMGVAVILMLASWLYQRFLPAAVPREKL